MTNIFISFLRILFTTGYLRGYSYAALWYLSILLGFYFLYAPLLPLLLLNRSDQTTEYFILISWLLQKMFSEVHGHPVRHLGGFQRLPVGTCLRGPAHFDRRSNPSSRKCSPGPQPSHKVILIVLMTVITEMLVITVMMVTMTQMAIMGGESPVSHKYCISG